MLYPFPPSSPHELPTAVHSVVVDPRSAGQGFAHTHRRGLRIATSCSGAARSPRSPFCDALGFNFGSPPSTPHAGKRSRVSSPPASPVVDPWRTRKEASPPKRQRTTSPDVPQPIRHKAVRFVEPAQSVVAKPRLTIVTMASPPPPPLEGSSQSPRSNSMSNATVTPSFLRSIQQVKLGTSPPNSDRSVSPPTVPPGLSNKRSNPKGLSLSLASSFHSTTEELTTPNPSDPGPSSSRTVSQTPWTSGPPQTPAPRGSGGSWGRATAKASRRPSLLSLITHPPGNDAPVPPTPSHGQSGYNTTIRSRGHARNRSAGANFSAFANYATEMDPRTSQSAYPAFRGTRPSFNGTGSSSSVSASSTSATDSVSSTPSTSPPGASADECDLQFPGGPTLPAEPYGDGPIQVIPGVWLGAEDSVWRWDVWAKEAGKVTIVNVAQEIENPFDESTPEDSWQWSSSGKAKVSLTEHDGVDHPEAEYSHPEVEYAHLRWSHGEGGLADVPREADLESMLSSDTACSARDKWRFWEAVRWLEIRRRAGIPIMIHCQCGVSRSATLAVAYIMTLACAGLVPSSLGHLRTMQDAYDYVKTKSPWIGPNVSLVFQLVEYARNLSTLLSEHITAGAKALDTQWPTVVDIESEDSWARRRLEFGEDADSPEEEARALDVAMAVRARRE